MTAHARRWWQVVAGLTVLAALLAAAALVRHWWSERAAGEDLRQRVASVLTPMPNSLQPCNQVAPPSALVVLALGQSNAANHGKLTEPTPRIPMITHDGCTWASDPLPGGTGRGGAIWSRLPAALGRHADSPPLLLSVLAVDASSIDQWTAPNSPLRALLVEHLARMRQFGRPPGLVLWHQGEADALRGTSATDYQRSLRALADTVAGAGAPVRLLLAASTICRGSASQALHKGMAELIAQDGRFGPGPDLDRDLSDADRQDGCHLNETGLSHAALLWAEAIRTDRRLAPYPAVRPK